MNAYLSKICFFILSPKINSIDSLLIRSSDLLLPAAPRERENKWVNQMLLTLFWERGQNVQLTWTSLSLNDHRKRRVNQNVYNPNSCWSNIDNNGINNVDNLVLWCPFSSSEIRFGFYVSIQILSWKINETTFNPRIDFAVWFQFRTMQRGHSHTSWSPIGGRVGKFCQHSVS